MQSRLLNGQKIIEHLQQYAEAIDGITYNDDPTNAHITFTIVKSETKFDWNEDDQALFRCTLNGVEYQPGMKGLTNLENARAEKFKHIKVSRSEECKAATFNAAVSSSLPLSTSALRHSGSFQPAVEKREEQEKPSRCLFSIM